MYTTCNPNTKNYSYIPVTVRATDGERNGQRKRIWIKGTFNGTVSPSNGKSANYLNVWIDGQKKGDHSFTRSASDTKWWYVDTQVGRTFAIAIHGSSYATKGSLARQSLRLELYGDESLAR